MNSSESSTSADAGVGLSGTRKSGASEDILEAFHAQPEIDFAYPTIRYHAGPERTGSQLPMGIPGSADGT